MEKAAVPGDTDAIRVIVKTKPVIPKTRSSEWVTSTLYHIWWMMLGVYQTTRVKYKKMPIPTATCRKSKSKREAFQN